MPVKVAIKVPTLKTEDIHAHIDHKIIKVQFTKIEKSQKEWIENAVIGLLSTAMAGGKKVSTAVKGKFTITDLPQAADTESVHVMLNGKDAGVISVQFVAPEEKKVEVATPVIEYESSKVETACSGLVDKIHSIFHAGKGYKGHGPVGLLGNANHAHVTNQDGIAFRWKGDALHVVSYGKKNDKAPTGSCGYDWIR